MTMRTTLNPPSEKVLWVGAKPSAQSRLALEEAAHAVDLSVHYCSYAELTSELDRESWRVVTIDLQGESANGLTHLREVHRDRPMVCVFAAGGETDHALLPQALASGAMDFLSLPMTSMDLNKALIKSQQRWNLFQRVGRPARSAQGRPNLRSGFGVDRIAKAHAN